VHTSVGARLAVRALIETLHHTLDGENLRAFMHMAAGEAMSAARLSAKQRGTSASAHGARLGGAGAAARRAGSS
jgi:hypothetical protein